MGDKYYGHTVSLVDDIIIEPLARGYDEKPSLHSVNASGSNNSIPQNQNYVNEGETAPAAIAQQNPDSVVAPDAQNVSNAAATVPTSGSGVPAINNVLQYGSRNDIINTNTGGDMYDAAGKGKDTSFFGGPRSLGGNGADSQYEALDKGVRGGTEIERTGGEYDVGTVGGSSRSGKKTIRTSGGNYMEFTEASTDDVPRDVTSLVAENIELGLETKFFQDKILIYDKDGNKTREVANGCYDSGVIYINVNSLYPFEEISSHEKVHAFKRKNETAYDELRQMVLSNVNLFELSQSLNEFADPVKEAYNKDVALDVCLEEILANLSYQIYSDDVPGFVTNVEEIKRAYETFWAEAKATSGTATAFAISDSDTTNAASAPVNADALQSAKEKIARYSEITGRKVVWYNDQSMPEHADENGFYENGTIYINENAENPFLEVFKHELFHSLTGKDKQAVIDFFKKNVAQNTKEFLDYKTKTIQAHRRKNLNYSTDDFWEEYAAQNSEFLLDEKTIDNMAKTNRTLAEKILEKIKELIAKIKSVFSAPKDFSADVAGHESGLVSGLSDTQLQKAQALYEKALYGASGTAEGTKYSIAGRQAKTADLDSLKQAKAMSRENKTVGEIYRQTGWYPGPDGKWRFEIDDSKMKIRSDYKGESTVRLGDYIEHEALFAAYPDLQDVMVSFENVENAAGLYKPNVDRIVLDDSLAGRSDKTALHEIQHAIQKREGFERGGTPKAALDYVRDRAKDYLILTKNKEFLETTIRDVDNYIDKFLMKQYNVDSIEKVGLKAYWSLYGEQEARMTASRKQLSQNERRENMPAFEQYLLWGDEVAPENAENLGYYSYEGTNLDNSSSFNGDMASSKVSAQDKEKQYSLLNNNQTELKAGEGTPAFSVDESITDTKSSLKKSAEGEHSQGKADRYQHMGIMKTHLTLTAKSTLHILE